MNTTIPLNPNAAPGCEPANKPIVPVARTPMSPAELDALRPQKNPPPARGLTITASSTDHEICVLAAALSYHAALPTSIYMRMLQLERRICQLEALNNVAPHMRDVEKR